MAPPALSCVPVLDWDNFQDMATPPVWHLGQLAQRAFTSSGRAAIYQALLQLQLPPNSTVLVPSYHCPSMVAPVGLAHLQVAFFGLRPDGLPDLERISPQVTRRSRAMLVSHYFGRAQSLAEVRQWCDAHGVALIEDCAHSYFGQAGERPVGAWGDWASASLSKFFPVPECGLLASAQGPLNALTLTRPSALEQVKGGLDVLQLATEQQRLAGLRPALSALFWLKNKSAPSRTPPNAPPATPTPDPARDLLHDCDMGRIGQAPLWLAQRLVLALPHGRIVTRRRQNFARYAELLYGVAGLRPLLTDAAVPEVPYAFAVWVDEADRVYQGLRAQQLPVFRWDRCWPGITPHSADVGPLWSRHVLQLLCHQDLRPRDIERTAQALLNLLVRR